MKECNICKNFTVETPEEFNRGYYHHVNCPKYATEKHPYLMYYEDAIDCWTFAPNDVESIVSVDNFVANEVKEIEFKVMWLTDKEVDETPEGRL